MAALAKDFGTPPALIPEKVGLGAGKKQLKDRPNMVRVLIGEVTAEAAALPGLEWRELNLIEANIDDMNPELWDAVYDRLFEAGALDVWLQPIQMKKNRPAQQLSVLCAPSAQNSLLEAVLRETTTLGARVSTVRRAALPREMREVSTPYGTVRIKAAHWPEGGVERTAPEWDDVKRLAQQASVPARQVYEAAVKAS